MDSITVAQLKTAIDADAVVIDVREGYEFADGHIPGAMHIPMATVPLRLAEFSTATTPYVVCQSGGRSWQVCAFLERNGITAINVDGGTGAWQASGYPVEVNAPTS
ncbi:MAG: rhodanese-like domain-containing protein [Candidatus Nanopelagicales bacterium]|nr:rhodanese-like domain-containing protein [Candidatus Nanopelagicales bacterium]MDP4824237.1 rhodanese-like domain-containing protein [Candidatus Nanopelagicales bacterium]